MEQRYEIISYLVFFLPLCIIACESMVILIHRLSTLPNTIVPNSIEYAYQVFSYRITKFKLKARSIKLEY